MNFSSLRLGTRHPKFSATGCEAGVQRCLSYYETDIKAIDRIMSSLELGGGTVPADLDTVLPGQHVETKGRQYAVLAEKVPVHSNELGAVDLVILPSYVSHEVRQLVQKYVHTCAVVATVLVDFEVKRYPTIHAVGLTPSESGFPRLVDYDYLYSLLEFVVPAHVISNVL